MGVESFADIAFSAGDVGSLVDISGTEFLDVGSFTDFDIPVGNIADLGGFDVAGSFAGNAAWFDTFNPGEILNNIPSIGDFNLGSITSSLPSLSDIKNVAGSITSDFSGYVKQAQSALQAYQKVAPAVNAVSSALGIQNPVNQLIQPLSQAVGIAGSAAGIAGRAVGATNSVINSANNVINTGTGFNILTDQQKAQVMAGVNPLFVNSLVDPGTSQPTTYNNAVQTVQELAPQIEQFQTQITGSQAAINQENENIVLYQSQLDDPNLTDTERAALEAKIQNSYENIATAQEVIDNTQPLLESTTASYTQAADVVANTNITTTNAPGAVSGQIVDQYQSVFDSSTGTYSIYDRSTGETVQTGLTQQAAILAEQNLNIATPGITLNSSATNTNSPYSATAGSGAATAVADAVATANGITAGQVNNARYQQSVRSLRNNKAQSSDWRVRLRLAPNSQYLYNDNNNGVLAPLRITDGIIFPYTPSIETAYKANYESYDLTHSNYRGYFYKNSYVDAVNIRAIFTAQDTKEADYLLAVIHFFRSCTKMFYGKDAQRGAPPPMVFLSGYGDYQFNEHPCLISQFNYTLPPDVDYIRAQSNLQSNTNQLNNRLRNPIANNPLSYSVNRLLNSSLFQGALSQNPAQTSNLANDQPTYVPTKMEIAITLLPTQSRSNISNNFSVQGFANGNLLKDGYW